jgi:hypothetical protein
VNTLSLHDALPIFIKKGQRFLASTCSPTKNRRSAGEINNYRDHSVTGDGDKRRDGWRAMELLPINENLEDGNRSVPDLGFNGSFSLMIAICEPCRRSSINFRFKLRLPSTFDATNHFSLGIPRQSLLA